MKAVYICLAIVLLSAVSCERKTAMKKEFPDVRELSANVLKINEIFKFGKIYKLTDYVVISDRSDNAENFFYVYRYPGFDFLYSFAKKGSGPLEYLMPTAFNQTPGNHFSFRDHGKSLFAAFLLTDTAAILTFTGDLEPTENDRFMDEINQVGDSLFLLKRQSARYIKRELWNLYAKELIDSIPNTFDLKKTMGDDYYAAYEEFYLSSRNERFVQCYLFMDAIEIGVIEDHRIHVRKRLGMQKPPEFYLMQKMGGPYGVEFLSNVMYYEGVACGEKHIYALYANMAMGHFALHPSEHSSHIEVYTWEGDPVAVFKINQSVQDIFVDEDTKTIYGINPEACEDCIFEYKFD
ncbi:MAG: TolB-like 6-bladed beta-propeller domain-containing protein [Prevotellaceae bacterium]|nr:TolB-like 6-bladed beta-propeller domain-containing protein [Prevotellaceae bacterium]